MRQSDICWFFTIPYNFLPYLHSVTGQWKEKKYVDELITLLSPPISLLFILQYTDLLLCCFLTRLPELCCTDCTVECKKWIPSQTRVLALKNTLNDMLMISELHSCASFIAACSSALRTEMGDFLKQTKCCSTWCYIHNTAQRRTLYRCIHAL